MNSESLRIARQLRAAFRGKPWHGSPLRDLLADVTAEQAQMKPLAEAHSIHELVLHIDIWVRVALGATQGVPMPKLWGTEKDWPAAADSVESAWNDALARMFEGADSLAEAIGGFSDDARLQDTVPGRDYDFYYLLHGVVQHSLYHGGQIAMLGRAVRASAAA